VFNIAICVGDKHPRGIPWPHGPKCDQLVGQIEIE
jgi:hypothetical protein